MRTLIILRGLPGAGKTSFANMIWESGVIFEADKYFINNEGEYVFDAFKLHKAHEWCIASIEAAMQRNKESEGKYFSEIVVSNTTTTQKEIQPYLDLAKAYEYNVVSLIVENRHGNVSVHGVAEETMDKMEKRFEIKLR
jgi:NEDD4-binding protein 2